MRMELIHKYLNAVCDMGIALEPEEADKHGDIADVCWYAFTKEEREYAVAELRSDRWIKCVTEEDLLRGKKESTDD